MAAFATSSSPAASAVAAAARPKVFDGAGKTKGGSAGCRVGIARKNFGRVVMALAVDASRFEGVPMAPPDPILGVSEAFKADKSDLKLNLGVGAYRTEELQPAVLNVVKKAENLMLEKGENKEYLPIEGLAAFNKATAELLLGADNPVIKQGRVATLQSLSGTGSLRLAAAFIQRYFPEAKVIISSPTWGNHKNIFNDARVPWLEYRYYDPKTVGLDFEGMIADIQVIILYRAKILEEIAKSLKLVIHSERIAELQENRYRAWIEIDKLSANSSEGGNTEVYFGDAKDTEYEAREDIAETVIQAIISATCITMGDINYGNLIQEQLRTEEPVCRYNLIADKLETIMNKMTMACALHDDILPISVELEDNHPARPPSQILKYTGNRPPKTRPDHVARYIIETLLGPEYTTVHPKPGTDELD